MSKRKKAPARKVCELCGDVFLSESNAGHYCPDCATWRKKNQCGKSAIRGKAALTGNMAAIERVNREAEAQGMSYGKGVGRQWAEENVKVIIPNNEKEENE